MTDQLPGDRAARSSGHRTPARAAVRLGVAVLLVGGWITELVLASGVDECCPQVDVVDSVRRTTVIGWVAGVVAGALVLVYYGVRKSRDRRIRLHQVLTGAALLGVFAGFLATSVTAVLNVRLDSGPATTRQVTVAGRTTVHGSKSTAYYLVISPRERISVSKSRYAVARIGDRLALVEHRGFFGAEWVDAPATAG